MDTNAIQIPAERLAPVAKEEAGGAKTVAAVVCCFLVLFIVAGIAMVAGEKPANASTSENTQEGASAIIGLAFWWIALGAVAQHYLKKGKRATEVALRAQENLGHQFFLDGKRILVNDAVGVPQPHLTFKVSGVRRKMLLEMPRATVVP
jgi:hypothetical protein